MEAESSLHELENGLSHARLLRQRGDVAGAKAAYAVLAQRFPSSAKPMLGLASMALECGRAADAVRALERALGEVALTYYRTSAEQGTLQYSSLVAEAHNSCGLLLLQLHAFREAHQQFSLALKHNANFAEAAYNRALASRNMGVLSDAERDYLEALAIRPEYPDALNNLGSVYLAQGRTREAASVLERALALAPESALVRANLAAVKAVLGEGVSGKPLDDVCDNGIDAPAHLYNLALAAVAEGKDDVAERLARKLVCAVSDHVGGREMLAKFERDKGQLSAAIAHLESVINVEPGAAERWSNVGVLYAESGLHDHALNCFRTALDRDPELIGASENLALVLSNNGQLEAAQEILSKVWHSTGELSIGLKLASLMLRRGHPMHAVSLLKELTERYPGNAELLSNLGHALVVGGQLLAGREALEEALILRPGFTVARWNLAFCYLACGDFLRGWENYEIRLSGELSHVECLPKGLPDIRLWQHEPIQGKRILVVGEQGYGDQIQCLRFVPALVGMGAHVELLLPRALRSLAETSLQHFGVRIAAHPVEGNYDFYVPTMSLPTRLGINEDALPFRMPYLRARQDDSDCWGKRVRTLAKGRLCVGLVWNGNPAHANDIFRSLAPEILRPLMTVEKVCWIGLNPAVSADCTIEGNVVHALGRECKDFVESAALVQNLDLVIAVDTAIAHLAGALSVPCWLMLAANSDWRWMLERDDSPWYPSIRLFRQQSLGDWEPVVLKIRDRLHQWSHSRTTSIP